MNLFETHTIEDHRKGLANFLPDGPAFQAKNIPDKNLFDLLEGLAEEAKRIEDIMNLISSDSDIMLTTDLIENWESALGIPDGCFPGPALGNDPTSLGTRRQHIKVKLSLQGDTRAHFIQIAHDLGFEKCEIHGGAAYGMYPLPYPWTYYSSPLEGYFTMYVHLEAKYQPSETYPFTVTHYPWPYSINATNRNILECLFLKIAPAMVNVIFIYDL